LEAVSEFKPDLILLDCNMPERSGGELAAELRIADLPGVKVAFLSADADSHQGRFQGLPIFAKPLRIDDLACIARTLLV
jgi:DNA-binding response OmpR family regulator